MRRPVAQSVVIKTEALARDCSLKKRTKHGDGPPDTVREEPAAANDAPRSTRQPAAVGCVAGWRRRRRLDVVRRRCGFARRRAFVPHLPGRVSIGRAGSAAVALLARLPRPLHRPMVSNPQHLSRVPSILELGPLMSPSVRINTRVSVETTPGKFVWLRQRIL